MKEQKRVEQWAYICVALGVKPCGISLTMLLELISLNKPKYGKSKAHMLTVNQNNFKLCTHNYLHMPQVLWIVEQASKMLGKV